MYTPTPDYYRDYIQHGMQYGEEDTIAHFGIKGMKWRKRKAKNLKTSVDAQIKKRKNKALNDYLGPNDLTQKGFPSSRSQKNGGGVGERLGGIYSGRKKYIAGEKQKNAMLGDSRYKASGSAADIARGKYEVDKLKKKKK